MAFKQTQLRWFVLTGALVLAMLLLGGCQGLPWQQKAPEPTATPTLSPVQAAPTATPMVLPPTYTPAAPPPATTNGTGESNAASNTGSTAETTLLATPTPAPAISGNTTTASDAPTFGGLCKWNTGAEKQPCLYNAGVTTYHGERVCRYVFENIPYPETAFVEINGAQMECVTLPSYPSRIYCMGAAPYRTPIQLYLGWYIGGKKVEVNVPQNTVNAIQEQHLFPLGEPPAPTEKPSNNSGYYP